MYINLNNNFAFSPFTNVDMIHFPSGFESTLRIQECPKDVTITTRIEGANDIFMIGLATDAARRSGAEKLNLILPFVPNARQDRSTVKGDAFGLRVFANFINSLRFNRVCVFDPHSPAVELLIDNCVAVPAWEFVRQALPNDSTILLCAPDAGAVKKTEITAKVVKRSFVTANKKRMPLTGEILGTDVYGEVKDKTVYILDDICDGGFTFIMLAKRLYELEAKEVHLVVSHGIFSKGLDPLYRAGIKSVTTTNSFNHTNNIEDEQISKVMDLDEYLKVIDIRNLLEAYLNN